MVDIKAEPYSDMKEDLHQPSDIEWSVDTDHIKFEGNSAIRSDSESSDDNQQSESKRAATSAQTLASKYKSDCHSALLSKYFHMACDLCDVVLSSYRDTNQHYQTVHDLDKGYLVCCSKKFYRLQHMLQHCEWHRNPDSFKWVHSLISVLQSAVG